MFQIHLCLGKWVENEESNLYDHTKNKDMIVRLIEVVKMGTTKSIEQIAQCLLSSSHEN